MTALVLTEWDPARAIHNFCATFQQILNGKPTAQWDDEILFCHPGPNLDLIDLSPGEKQSFKKAILMVSVPVLRRDKESNPYPQNIILPITKSNPIGEGSYATVYKVQIAAGCLLIDNKALSTNSGNQDEDFFAWKKMHGALDAQRELEFVRDYDKSTRTSNLLVAHLAIIEKGISDTSILYPLAQGDLQKLLEGSLMCKEWPDNDPSRFHKIIKKCHSLADGLAFLHNEFYNEGVLVCRHGDLKPNNFLIFEEEWKISDMGLARVKDCSSDEHGARITTKTSRTAGCGPYAAPEMMPEGAMVGRSTDVWALAAIIMEVIIWGFGGPNAWKEFEKQRRQCGGGHFHHNNQLNRAVENELNMWPTRNLTQVARYLQGNESLAGQVLRDLVQVVRKALTINDKERATSKELLADLKRVLKHVPKSSELGTEPQSLQQLYIHEEGNTTTTTTTTSALLRTKLDKHLKHDFFQKFSAPRVNICVSSDTQSSIKKWIRSPTPTALGIGGDNIRISVSSITHELYYTARSKDYKVVKFLTLDRYDDPPRDPLKPSLDLVYCFIEQFFECWGGIDRETYNLDQLGIHDDTASSYEAKFAAAVAVLGDLIKTYGPRHTQKPLIVIIDEFWRVYPGEATETVKQQWGLLLGFLGCAQSHETSASTLPPLKVLIRTEGSCIRLKSLGFNGATCNLQQPKQQGPTLRTMVRNWF
ncbi:MAG: hypothetical protein Q9180_002202 [Flavoplaca navasiana]